MYQEIFVEVEQVIHEDDDIQLLATSAGAKKAMLYKVMFPPVEVGEQILVNHTAVSLSLGTGGWDIVKTVFKNTPHSNNQGNGHIMKARYLPSQHSVLAVESQESEYHHYFQNSFSLHGKPVLIAELHSMIPIVYTTLKAFQEEMKLTVIISDEASIPLMMSEHVRILKKDNRVTTISIGQAFGGDIEAVNLQTALQCACTIIESDMILISLGPGVVGTGTKYGFSGIVLADWANIIGCLGGKPVWIPRISFMDKRPRHQGISHHMLTPLLEFTYAKSFLPIPVLPLDSWRNILEHQLQDERLLRRHELIWFPLDQEFIRLCKRSMEQYPVTIKTMGRGFDDDPAFFYGVYVACKWVLDYNKKIN